MNSKSLESMGYRKLSGQTMEKYVNAIKFSILPKYADDIMLLHYYWANFSDFVAVSDLSDILFLEQSILKFRKNLFRELIELDDILEAHHSCYEARLLYFPYSQSVRCKYSDHIFYAHTKKEMVLWVEYLLKGYFDQKVIA